MLVPVSVLSIVPVSALSIVLVHMPRFVLGLMLAIVGMTRVLWRGDGTGFMLTIGLTLVAIPFVGCTVGAMLPLILRRVGLDPATSSSPFIATLIDALGIVVYFNVAQILLADVIAASMKGH